MQPSDSTKLNNPAMLVSTAVEVEKRTFRELPFTDLDCAVLAETSRYTLAGFVTPLPIGTQIDNLSPVSNDALQPNFVTNETKLQASPTTNTAAEMTATNDSGWTPLSQIMRTECVDELKSGPCPWIKQIDLPFILAVGASPRYGAITAGLYAQRRSKAGEPAEQFAATTFHLPDNTYLISFSGTDLSIEGWREDFNMLYEPCVPSQHDALSYVRAVAKLVEGPLRLGGHSKGGMVAEYAAFHLEESIASRIVSIHNLDGPGLRCKPDDKSIHKELRGKFRKIVPQSSFYGLLFTDPNSIRVVKSRGVALTAHPVTSWKAGNGDFADAQKLKPFMARMAYRLQRWYETLSIDERKQSIEAIFAVLEAHGVTTIERALLLLVGHLPTTLRAYRSLPKHNRTLLRRTVRSFAVQIIASVTVDVVRRK